MSPTPDRLAEPLTFDAALEALQGEPDEGPRPSLPSLSDAMDLLGLDGACPGLVPIARDPAAPLVAGPAYPVRFEPVTPGAPAPAADYIDQVPAGAVVVLANGGRTDCTVWGGILTHRARQLGVRATVIDGVCRDVAEIATAGYPLFAKGAYMQSGKNRARMAAAGEPVEVAGIPVRPGDIVTADGNGVLVIPRDRLGEVVARALEVENTEAAIVEALESGESLEAARKRHRYHQLALQQTRGKHDSR